MKQAAMIRRGVARRLAAPQTIFTAKGAKIAKGAKEETRE
jgi:hypothetical protein